MRYLVTGGTSGLGLEIKNQLEASGLEVDTLSDNFQKANYIMDLSHSYDDIDDALDACMDELPPYFYDVVIHCAGENLLVPHGQIEEPHLLKLLRLNAFSNFFLNRKLKPKVSCSIISDAAWTPMTHSLAYNVSKAAQLMIVKQMAHENKETISFGVAPGKIHSTKMSKYIDETFPGLRGWSYEQGREYQLSKLRTGEMPPEIVASFVVFLVTNPYVYYNGHIFPIGG